MKKENREKKPPKAPSNLPLCAAEVEAIKEAFRLPTPQRIIRVSGGLIHRTYRVDTKQGRFALQALHPKLSSPGILEDYAVVTDHLAKQGFPAPQLIRSSLGEPAVTIGDTRWRLTTWLLGNPKLRVDSPQTAWQAANILGRFHRATDTLDHTFKSDHPLHDTAFHAQRLQSSLDHYDGHGQKKLDTDWLPMTRQLGHEALDRLSAIQAEIAVNSLPVRVVHGDPKISNVLFDENGHTAEKKDIAVGLVDLDTCTRHTVLVDLGDAIRSWTASGAEEATGPFREDIFEAMLKGYGDSGSLLNKEEKEKIPLAGALITWELCARFLWDTFEDSYFGWDATRFPSRRAHNLMRAQSMASLGRQLDDKRRSLETLVKKVF